MHFSQLELFIVGELNKNLYEFTFLESFYYLIHLLFFLTFLLTLTIKLDVTWEIVQYLCSRLGLLLTAFKNFSWLK